MRLTQRSRTAQYVAQTRALLTAKGVLDDPFAYSMLTPSMKAATAAMRTWPLRRWITSPFFAALATRIRFFDYEVESAIEGGIGQIAIVGAGYDSRSWRYARPGVQFFEIDHPATQIDKRQRAPSGGPTYVPLDLTTSSLSEGLDTAGFAWTQPAAFLIEGVTMYLTAAEVRSLLAELARQGASGSRLAVNFAAPPASGSLRDRRRQRLLRWLGAAGGEHHQFFLRASEAADFVAACGWPAPTARSLRDLAPDLIEHTYLKVRRINPEATVVSAVLS